MARNATADLEIGVDCYATYEDVALLIPHSTLNSTTRPSKAQAIKMIRDSFDTMNGAIDVLGYSTPVPSSNATSISILGRINAYDAASQIEQIQYSAGNAVGSEHSSALTEKFNLMWTELKKGSVSLPAAARKGTYMHKQNEKHASSQFYVVESTEQDPVFTRDMKF